MFFLFPKITFSIFQFRMGKGTTGEGEKKTVVMREEREKMGKKYIRHSKKSVNIIMTPPIIIIVTIIRNERISTSKFIVQSSHPLAFLLLRHLQWHQGHHWDGVFRMTINEQTPYRNHLSPKPSFMIYLSSSPWPPHFSYKLS